MPNDSVTTFTASRKERKPIPIRLPVDMHQELKLLSLFTGRSINEIMTELVDGYLAGQGRELIERGMTARAQATYGDALDKLAE
jgi:hypothetical protein